MTTITTPTTREAFRCPEWCSDDHASEIEQKWIAKGDYDTWHYGPSFGRHISVGVYGDRPLAMIDDLTTDDATAADLRQLAADALAAAEWIESQG